MPAPKPAQLKHLDRKSMAGMVAFVHNVVVNHRPWVYACAGVLVIVSAIGISQVQSIGFMVDDLPHHDKVYTDLKFFESRFKGVMPFEVVVDTKEKGGLKQLKTLQKIDKFQKRMREFSCLTKPVSMVEFLKLANQAWYYNDPRRYRLPTLQDLGPISSYLPKQNGVFKGSVLSSMVDSNFSKARISFQMADIGSVETEKLRNEVRKIADEIFPKNEYNVLLTGTSLINLKGNEYLIDNLIQGLIFALIVISLLNALMFFNYKMMLISLLPNLLPLALTLGIMGFASVPLKNSTILVFSVAYGIVVDLTVHFLAKYRIELKKREWNIRESVSHSIEESGFSMIYTTIILFFGFVIFVFSKFGGTVALGALTSISLVVGLAANLFLLPALLLSFEKSFKKEELASGIIELEDEEA
jgi:predicted RND superfamily exporter protein